LIPLYKVELFIFHCNTNVALGYSAGGNSSRIICCTYELKLQTNDFLEFITAVPEFNEKKRFGVIKSIAIHVENDKPRDTSFVAFRLNLYNKEKKLIFSKDDKFRLSEIRKSIDFDINTAVINGNRVAYVGISGIVDKTTEEQQSPYDQICLDQEEFKEAKTYAYFINKLSHLNSEWQLYSRYNDQLSPLLLHLFQERGGVDKQNHNLKIEIVSEKISK